MESARTVMFQQYEIDLIGWDRLRAEERVHDPLVQLDGAGKTPTCGKNEKQRHK